MQPSDRPNDVLKGLEGIPTVGSFVGSNIRDAAAALGVFDWSDSSRGRTWGRSVLAVMEGQAKGSTQVGGNRKYVFFE